MKSHLLFSLSCIVGHGLGANSEMKIDEEPYLPQELPSKSGNHFYADFRTGNNGVHFADLLGGELQEDLDLWVTTSAHQLGLFTEVCPHWNCNVPDRWNPHDSRSSKIVNSEIYSEQALIYNEVLSDEKVVPNTLMGTLMNDHFFIAFQDVEHETSLAVDFFAIEKAAQDFKSSYDGYLGLAPYSASNRDKEKSFLY